MLYEIAHVIKERFGFLWDAIEWGNAEVFALMHRGGMKRIPELLGECSGRYKLRLATVEDVERMRAFFEGQPEEAFRFFQPHEFDEKGIRKVVGNKSYLTFLAIDEGLMASPNENDREFTANCSVNASETIEPLNHLNPSETSRIAGYFFMRSFVNGKTFKGYMVGIDHRGQGVAREIGIAMNRVAKELGLRMFKSISPENPASLAVTKKVNDIKIIKTLDNGDMLIECFEKADNQRIGGGNFFLFEIEIVNESRGLHVESYKCAA